MAKVSVIIPAREEPFLLRTINTVLDQARGEIEVLVALDGWRPTILFPADPRLMVLWSDEVRGLRPTINAAVGQATGAYVMKLDAHCSISEGFDVVLQEACEPNWLMVPEKYSLNGETWDRFRDAWQYFYLTFPYDPSLAHIGLHEKNFSPTMNRQRASIFPIDDIITFQGSCWFLPRAYFFHLGPMDAERYYCAQEAPELGLKAWTDGGRVVVHKGVWYAHLFKGKRYRRGFRRHTDLWERAMYASATYWMTHPRLSTVVDRFWPFLHQAPIAPWPDDWANPAYRVAAEHRRAA